MSNPINDHLLVTCEVCGCVIEADGEVCPCRLEEYFEALDDAATCDAVAAAHRYLDGEDDLPF